MKYYLLQIKEGPHGGPFHDTVNKWISSGYAAVFTKDPLDKIGTNPVSADVERFIELFNTTQNDDSIILSIGEDETSTDTLYIYQKNGPLEEITSLSVDKKNYKTCNYVDNAIGFKIKLLKKIKVVECPLVLATIKSNTRLTMGTFKSIEDPNNPESHMNSYFGNIKALEYILKDKKEKVSVNSFAEYLECLSPIEFETLIAKLKEEEGYFVPAYKGGMLKDYDLICKKNGQQENIQIKLNLSKDTYNKYKKKGLIIYCVSKSEKIVDPTVTIYDWKDIEKQINKSPNTKKWLSLTLDWVCIKGK
ncbi:MAG: hypothetical protein SOZ24_02245 [Treponema sp.]|nr:hypothetical protein [Treponema sp.]